MSPNTPLPDWVPDMPDKVLEGGKKVWYSGALPKGIDRKFFAKLATSQEPLTGDDLKKIQHIHATFERLAEELDEKVKNHQGYGISQESLEEMRIVQQHLYQLRESIHTIIECAESIRKKEAEPSSKRDETYCEFRRAAIRQNQAFMQEIITRLQKLPKRPGPAGPIARTLMVMSFLGLTSFTPQNSEQPLQDVTTDTAPKVKKPAKKLKGGIGLNLKMRGNMGDFAEGEELDSKDNHGRPNIDENTADEETGIPSGKVGTFEFADENAREKYASRLWVTVSAKPLGAEKEYELKEGANKGNLIAKASLKNVRVKSGQTYRLPHPVGTIIRISSTSSNHHHINAESESIFGENEGVDIEYEIYESASSLVEGKTTQADEDAADTYGPDEQETIGKIKEMPAAAGMILHNYAHHFTYITSSQLQKIFDQIPGSFQDKVQFMKFGDCDVLAHHMGDILQKAGIPANIISGFLDKDGKTFSTGNRHAQVAFEHDREVSIFEATAGTRKAFQNVRFMPKDLTRLQEIAQKIQDAADYNSQIAGYQEFNKALEEILDQPEYQEFIAKGMSSPEQNMMSTMKDELEKNSGKVGKNLEELRKLSEGDEEGFWEGFGEWLNSQSDGDEAAAFAIFMLLLVLAIGGIGAATIRTGTAIEASYYRRQKRLLEESIKEFHKGIQDVLGETRGEPAGESIMKTIETIGGGRKKRWIPSAIYQNTTPEGRNIIHVFCDLMQQYGEDRLIGHMLLFSRQKAWEKFFEKIKKGGGDPRQIKKILQSMGEKPKLRKAAEEQKERIKTKILRKGKELIHPWVDKKSNPRTEDHVRIRSDILRLQAIGDRPVEKRKAKHLPGVWSAFETRPYQPGDDFRTINWNHYAKTGELSIDQKEPEVDTQAIVKEKYTLIIDVANARIDELTQLTALLYYARRFPREVGITGIELYAYGMRLRADDSSLQTFEGKTGVTADSLDILRKIRQQGSEGIRNIQVFIKHLVDLKLQHTWFLRRLPKELKEESGNDYHFGLSELQNASWGGINERRMSKKRKDQNFLIIGDTGYCRDGLAYSYRFRTTDEVKKEEIAGAIEKRIQNTG